MHSGKIITAVYSVISVILCIGITTFLNNASFDTISKHTPAPVRTVQTVEAAELTPVQQALLEHINKIEDPSYRHSLIFKRIEKLLEENYTEENLHFADPEFVPKAGRAYVPKDVVVTDGALILKKYANIPDDTPPERLMVLNTGACLIDSVPYFWGGKASNKGWNKRWGQDVVVSGGSFIAQCALEGSEELRYANADGSEVLISYGLDCSGFVDWAYWTALNYRIGSSTRQQFANSNPITEEELMPGDLGFLASPDDPMINHVGLYVGLNDNGQKMWLHCSSTKGVTINSPDFVYYRRPNIDIYYNDEETGIADKH